MVLFYASDILSTTNKLIANIADLKNICLTQQLEILSCPIVLVYTPEASSYGQFR